MPTFAADWHVRSHCPCELVRTLGGDVDETDDELHLGAGFELLVEGLGGELGATLLGADPPALAARVRRCSRPHGLPQRAPGGGRGGARAGCR